MLKKDFNKSHLDVEGFKEYLEKFVFTEDEEINFVNKLCNETNIYLFSGVIRDYFFSTDKTKPRDIDIVLEDDNSSTSKLLNKYQYRTTQFGGYKLRIGGKKYDIWPIKKTWYFQNCLNVLGDWHKYKLPKTAFFNVSAVIYSLNENKFYENGFSEIVKNKNKYLGVVNASNPFPSLCIIRAIDYKKRYNFRLKSDLIKYILSHYENEDEELIKVQIKHFGRVKYSKETISQFVHSLENRYSGKKNKETSSSQLTFEL